MSTKAVAQRDALKDAVTLLNTQYGCGRLQFAGTDEALARSVRDIPSQRWLLTERNLECAGVPNAKEREMPVSGQTITTVSAANPKTAR